MKSKTFKLPSEEEMLRRLKDVDKGPHLVERFYPLLMKHAGEPKTASGVVLLIKLAISSYSDLFQPPANSSVAALLEIQIGEYIDALCPDAENAAAAKKFLKQVTV